MQHPTGMADPPPTPGPGGRLPSLDGLRAASIAAVTYSHAVGDAGFPHWLDWPLHDGALGVRVFFVLSGFLITRLMLDEQGRTGRVSLPSFYRRRAIRILPVLWAFLLFVAALWAAGAVSLRPANLLMPLTFTNGFPFWPGRPAWVTGQTWSLAVEEQFYLVWPAAFAAAALPRGGRAQSGLLLGVLAALLVAGPVARWWMYIRPKEVGLIYTAVGNADMIAWGCVLAVLWQLCPGTMQRVLAWRPAWGRAAALAVVLGAPRYAVQAFGLRFMWVAWSAQAAAIAYLIGSLIQVHRGASYRLLNARPVVWLGLISYSLYLWQQPFLMPAGFGGRAAHAWQRWPLNLACAVAAAGGSYWLIERPARRFRRAAPRTAGFT